MVTRHDAFRFLMLAGLLATPLSARADDKWGWYEESEDDENERDEDDERDAEEDHDDGARDDEDDDSDEGAPQEEGSIDDEESAGSPLTRGSVSLYAGALLGLGGTLTVDSPGLDAEADMAATYGLMAGGDYVLHDYVALGGELRLSAINTEAAEDASYGRDRIIDLVVRPRGRYVLGATGLELFASLPVGVSFPFINSEKGGDASTGFTLGAGLGAIYFLGRHFGLSGEAMWLMHWFGTEGAGSVPDETARIGQFTLLVSALYAL